MRVYIALLIFTLVAGCVFNKDESGVWSHRINMKEAIETKSEGEHDFRWGTCMKCGYVIEGFHWENIPKICVEKEWIN